MTSKSAPYIQHLLVRRSRYNLTKTPALLSDAQLRDLVTTVVKHSPSSFNSQSSRVVLLLGTAHDAFWTDTVPAALRRTLTDTDPASLERNLARLSKFANAAGTALFFEDGGVVQALKERTPAYAELFGQFSAHSTGMAQINLWTALSLEGYGANLQHYAAAGPPFLSKHNLPPQWVLHAQLVFGALADPGEALKEKTFLPDEERVRVLGASSAAATATGEGQRDGA